MLTHLHIKNYALIEELDISFDNGFSVITGETGAGKSILLGAIGLLLGQRADSRSIQNGAKKCVIEAEFQLEGFGLESFFETNEFDFENNTCIIRRELTDSGKSRAFVNDTPASVSQLKQLGAYIIDIHSQHQNLLLANENYQMDILDILGQNQENLNAYNIQYKRYRQLKEELETIRQQAIQNKENEDYIQYQLQQLDTFNPTPGEDDTLQEEVSALSHAEDIKQALFQATDLMNQDACGVVPAIRQAQQLIHSIEQHYPVATEWSDRLQNAYIDLKDLGNEMENCAENISYDPQRLEELNNRLDELFTLEKKHHVNSAEELCQLRTDFRKKLDDIENIDGNIAALENELAEAFEHLTEKAGTLTQVRRHTADLLQQKMSDMLKPLGMPNARIEVNITPTKSPAEKGMDQVTFYFSANKNSQLRPIAEVASGGEVARLMLTFKTLISEVKQLPTIIFDEIDTGVSGTIAECMAQMMQQMATARHMQVISITHLPQIAALGTSHYRVYKEDTQTETRSHIKRLDNNERIQEIANMLSGSQITQAAIDNARQLLKL